MYLFNLSDLVAPTHSTHVRQARTPEIIAVRVNGLERPRHN